MTTQLIRSLTVLSGLLLISVAAAAQRYSIHLDQPQKAGSKYHLSAISTQTRKLEVKVADNIVQNNSEGFTLELSAEVTIVEANPSGWARRMSVRIGTSRFKRGTITAPLLPPDTMVLASIENGTTVYRVNGKPVDEAIASALKSVISLHVSSVGNDALFGTPSPKRVGDTWKVNIDFVHTLLKEMQANAEGAQILGSSKLVKVEQGHLNILGTLYIMNAVLPAPSGFTPESGEIRSELKGRYPIRPGSHDWGEVSTITIRMTDKGHLESGEAATFMMEYKSASQFEITPLSTIKSRNH